MRWLELRTYRLRRGSGPRFHALVAGDSVPLQRAAGIDVVAFGTSLHDGDEYVLARAFDSPEQREQRLAAFYASAAWRNGPREAIVALIDADTTALLRLGAGAVDAMRVAGLGGGPGGCTAT